MCDCAEARQKACMKCCGPHDEISRDEPPADYTKQFILALSALLFGILVYLLYSLDRRTIRKILTMLGLGFLFAQRSETKPACPPKPKPDPCATKPPEPIRTCETPKKPEKPDPKACTCKDPKPKSACKVPPSPPPSCKAQPERKQCGCPDS